MDFDFSEDQKLLADQVKRFLDEQCTTAVVRESLEGTNKCANGVWQGLADMGLVATAIPEAHGGTGAGYLELCLVAQQVGAHIAPVPFGSTVYLVTEALLQHGSEEQKQAWLPRISRGDVKAALACTEDMARLAPEQITTAASGGELTGNKSVVTDGNEADLLLVLARDDEGLGLHLVASDQAGVTATPVESIDLTRDVARLSFQGASAERIAGDGWAQLQGMYDRAAVLYAFEQLGGAQAALDMAVAYAQERFAFGRAIGSFQAIKHMLADMYVAMKLAENNCYYAAWALANDAPDLPLAAATARVGATQAYQLCAKDNVQVHGGMGFTWEFDCHLHYRRSNYLALELGSLSEWETRLVRALPLKESA